MRRVTIEWLGSEPYTFRQRSARWLRRLANRLDPSLPTLLRGGVVCRHGNQWPPANHLGVVGANGPEYIVPPRRSDAPDGS